MNTVVAGVIVKGNLVLIAQKKNGLLAGKWEFPGGKINQDESPQDALLREIEEEFGVTVNVGEFIDKVPFSINSTECTLVAYYAHHITGDYNLVDHSQIAWIKPEELLTIDFAPADIPIAQRVAMQLNNNGG